MNERLKRSLLLGAAVLLAGSVFATASLARYDFAISILYLAVLVIVSAGGGKTAVKWAALSCGALVISAWAIVHYPSPTFMSALQCLFVCVAIGVTAALLVSRKKFEATKRDLERSRSEVELFANSVPFVLWRSNPQGEIEYLNESWTTVTGLDRWSVLEGQRYNDVVHPDDIPALNETVSAAVANRTVTDLKVRVRQADGSYRWMQIYDNPAFSPLTGLVERFGGLSDVHNEVIAQEELIRVRAELEDSRRELINFTNSVPQILFRANREAQVDFYNQRFTEVTGRDLHAVMAKQDWIEDFHPDDRPDYMANLERSFAAGEELNATFRLRHADGSYRWMSLLGRPVPIAEGSDDIRYYGGVTDIHEQVTAHQKVRELNETLERRVTERTAELMRTETRYAGLFHVSNMTFAETDFSAAYKFLDELKSNGVVDLREFLASHPRERERTLSLVHTTRVNEALARLMGYASATELIAHWPTRNTEDGEEMLLRQLEMYYYKTDHMDGRTALLGKSGQRIPVYFNVSRLAEGVYLSSFVDLSEQERIEGLRRATQAELARANRVATVGALSASIAHELNQPITALLVEAQAGLRYIGRGDPDLDVLGRLLQRIDKTAQRAAGIVQRTRANIVAGRRAVKAIDICRLAEETHDLLEHDLKRSGVGLSIRCPQDTALMVDGDPVELQQVFVNLVSNAADAMRDQPGPRHISIAIGCRDEAVRVSVSDTGPGIPEEHIERLFEPFFTTKPTGIGMGLQICRTAIEGMGGQLVVANLPEGGASFAFDLPIAFVEEGHARR